MDKRQFVLHQINSADDTCLKCPNYLSGLTDFGMHEPDECKLLNNNGNFDECPALQAVLS